MGLIFFIVLYNAVVELELHENIERFDVYFCKNLKIGWEKIVYRRNSACI